MAFNKPEKIDFNNEASKNGFKSTSDGKMRRGNDTIHYSESGNSVYVNGSHYSSSSDAKKRINR